MYLRLKVGMKTVKKEQNYGRETKMLPLNKVAKKRVNIGVYRHFLSFTRKKTLNHCGVHPTTVYTTGNKLSGPHVYQGFPLIEPQ